MAIRRPSYAVNNIQTLANVVKGQPNELKQAFDKVGSDNKDYIANVLISDIEAEYVTTEDIEGLIVGQVPDGTVVKYSEYRNYKRKIGLGVI